MDSTQQPRLGVSWVLRQAAILAVLAFTAVHLAGVTCLALVQRRVALVAEQAAAEARLSRASLRSVQRRAAHLLEREGVAATVTVSLQRNSRGNRGLLRTGDQVLVDVAAVAHAALPPVLARLAPWLTSESIHSEAEAIVP